MYHIHGALNDFFMILEINVLVYSDYFSLAQPGSMCAGTVEFVFITKYTVYRVIFPCVSFVLLHLQTILPSLEYAQLCLKRDNLGHWNSSRLKIGP